MRTLWLVVLAVVLVWLSGCSGTAGPVSAPSSTVEASCGPEPERTTTALTSTGSRDDEVEVRVWVEPSVREATLALDVDVEQVVRDAVVTAARQLPPRDEPVSVAVAEEPAKAIIPGLGVGAWTTHSIAVAVDPDSEALDDGLAYLPALVAHEVHHVWRFASGSGRPQGLAAAVVSEGLADHFAQQVHPDIAPGPWTDAVPESELADWWERLVAADAKDTTTKDHDRWFLGTDDVPVWTGYTLGWELVGGYLDCSRRGPSDVVGTQWQVIVDGAGPPWSTANP